MAEAAEKKIELRVIAPTMETDKSPYRFRKEVDMVIMRCSTGDMGILPGRVPVSSVLGTGVLRIFDEDSERHMAVLGGVAHVSDNVVTILSDCAQKPDELDLAALTTELKDLQSLYEKTAALNEKQTISNDIHRCKVQIEVAETVKK